jgi:hypothetical protein
MTNTYPCYYATTLGVYAVVLWTLAIAIAIAIAVQQLYTVVQLNVISLPPFPGKFPLFIILIHYVWPAVRLNPIQFFEYFVLYLYMYLKTTGKQSAEEMN